MTDRLVARLPILAVVAVALAAAITLPIVLINRDATTAPPPGAAVTAATPPGPGSAPAPPPALLPVSPEPSFEGEEDDEGGGLAEEAEGQGAVSPGGQEGQQGRDETTNQHHNTTPPITVAGPTVQPSPQPREIASTSPRPTVTPPPLPPPSPIPLPEPVAPPSSLAASPSSSLSPQTQPPPPQPPQQQPQPPTPSSTSAASVAYTAVPPPQQPPPSPAFSVVAPPALASSNSPSSLSPAAQSATPSPSLSAAPPTTGPAATPAATPSATVTAIPPPPAAASGSSDSAPPPSSASSSSASPSLSGPAGAAPETNVAGQSSDAGGSPHLLTSPHYAHAVPGLPYVVDDVDDDKVELVQLDASRSHSHYFRPPATVGSITSWLWSFANGTFIQNSSTPIVAFPVGTTVVNLTVVDNFDNTHWDTTNVTVRASEQPGFFCYFYPGKTPSEQDPFTINVNPVVELKPVRGAHYPAIDFAAASQLPAAVRDRALQVRCTFRIPPLPPSSASGAPAQPRVIDFQLKHHGPARLLKQTTGADFVPVFATTIVGQTLQSAAQVEVPAEGLSFQIWYYRPTAQSQVKLHLIQGGKGAMHELSTQLPLIHSIAPHNSTLAGGGLMTVYGSGLWNDPYVYFGTNPVAPIAERSDRASKLTVVVPPATEAGTVPITIGNRFGGSNAVTFNYSPDGLSPILFDELRVRDQANATFGVTLVTNIKLGPDHRYYLASLDSFVYSVSISKDLVASDLCASRSLGKSRTVIGLAFNPADSGSGSVVLYASSSVFFWGRAGQPPLGNTPWANGMVHKLSPGLNGDCLGISDQPVISGLPVSNHDHGVNGLLFDDDGRLLIMVGSATNAGVIDSSVGDVDESPLSAACLIANVNKPGFDGRIQYDSTDAGTARKVSGDVELYSTGWRNSFELTLHSNGFIYATENGANSEFGNRSLTCDSEAPISPYESDDKIAKVLAGKFGGHANRNRGRDKPAECTWRGPFDEATNNYNPPIATVESSTDGIIEYTAETFRGQLKGNLLMSKYSSNDPSDSGKLYRLRLDGASGDRDGPVETLWEASGLSVVMSAWGDILMPQLYNKEIIVLRARVSDAERDRQRGLIAVTPFRGPVAGGNTVLVTGAKLAQGAVAVFGGKECSNVREATDESFKCDVPPGTPGSVAVHIRMADGTLVRSSRGAGYRYMRV